MNFSVVEKNHEIFMLEGSSENWPAQPPQWSQLWGHIRLLRNWLSCVLSTSRDGCSAAPLDSEPPLLQSVSAASRSPCEPLRSKVTKTSCLIPPSAFFRTFLGFSHWFLMIHESGPALNLNENLNVIFWFNSRPVPSKTCPMSLHDLGKKLHITKVDTC